MNRFSRKKCTGLVRASSAEAIGRPRKLHLKICRAEDILRFALNVHNMCPKKGQHDDANRKPHLKKL